MVQTTAGKLPETMGSIPLSGLCFFGVSLGQPRPAQAALCGQKPQVTPNHDELGSL